MVERKIEDRNVTKRERKILVSAMMLLNGEQLIKESFAEALAFSHGDQGKVERTNLIGRMRNRVDNMLRGKIVGYTKFGFASHVFDVCLQTYQFNQDSDNPLVTEHQEYRGDGNIIVYITPTFDVDEVQNKNNNGIVPIFSKARGTTYSNAQSMGNAWKVYAKNMTEQVLVMVKTSKTQMLKMWMATGEYKSYDENGKLIMPSKREESHRMRYLRAGDAIDYLIEKVMGQPIVFSPVPDSRSRVSKYRVFFTDGRELDNRYTWMLNWYSNSWRTNMFELYYREELNEDGLEAMKVTAARYYHKKMTAKRLSWRKAIILFKKERIEVGKACMADTSHGLYYPRMYKTIVEGVGSLTGFMLEADLSASGIGSAAMNIHSKGIAEHTSLCGKMTPSDAHRSIVEKIMRKSSTNEAWIQHVIRLDYDMLKKLNTEITHAQTIPVTAEKWTVKLDFWAKKLEVQYPLDIVTHEDGTVEQMLPKVSEEDVRNVYADEMPGLLQWIESTISITKVGVLKGHSVLTWRAPDGVKCSTAAYTKARSFSAVCVTKDDKTRRLALKTSMPIEIGPKGIVYEGPEGKYQNKMMGVWANLVQADDAWMKREISLACKAQHGFVPIVKHDGYYAHANNIKVMVERTYDVRKLQFEKRPIKSGFEQMAQFLGIKKIDLPDYGMTMSDFKCATPSESPLMMT